MSSARYWVPSTEIQNAHSIREVALMTEHLKDRRIFIMGEITREMAQDTTSQLLFLDKETKPISIIINSPGGSVSDGLMIYDVIKMLKSPVEMYCMGVAASMAALIFSSGKKGKRHILPHAKTMIHEPQISGGSVGFANSISRVASSIMETNRAVNEILAKNTGRTLEEIDEATSFDNYMNAKESIEFGLCDDIAKKIT